MGVIYDSIIIGAGPAGLSAAIYAGRAEMKTLVIETMPMEGGQIVNTYEVDNYPGLPGITGFELAVKFREHAQKFGAVFKKAAVTGIETDGEIKKVFTKDGQYEAKTLILATGAGHRLLGVKGEKELSGMGVSYCATCDGAFFKNKDVAVVGGGDVALEDALFLARSCRCVYLIHRRDAFRGARLLQKKVQETDNIKTIMDTEVIKIEGEGQITSVEIHNRKSGENESLPVQGIFIAVGTLPNTAAFSGSVKLDEQGYIVADERGITSAEGIFAAGDVRTKALRQVVTAASDGANAVISAENYINTH